MKTIELLSPARTPEIGIEAINHGADAVYIGAGKFGARKSAGNSMHEIEKLIQYAHKFGSKIYITLNTILFDHEIDEAIQIANDAYNAGADALIIQDMGLLECNLPPIAIHASTQTNNISWQKVDFLEKVGFKRVVLARELNLEEIRIIHKKTNVELEFFIHGALCVSYSGQCYMGYAINRRSGNRGECSQPCRMKYNLLDEKGNILIKDKHLLSLSDLNHSNNLEELMQAGICSFKIEGRLKDMDYVKNITAYYRKKLDSIMEKGREFAKSSNGKCKFLFEPDAEKSFHRGKTEYFLHQRQKSIASPNSPKSTGEFIGTALHAGKNYFELENGKEIHTGDGICFFGPSQELLGSTVNKTDGNRIFLSDPISVVTGTKIFRNHDRLFIKILGKKSAERTIDVKLSLAETNNGFALIALDENNIQTEISEVCEKQLSEQWQVQSDKIKEQLKKSGGSIFNVVEICDFTNGKYFIPISVLNHLRRKVLYELENARMAFNKPKKEKTEANNYPYFEENANYKANIANSKAVNFYKRHGVKNIENAFELETPSKEVQLMQTKYCIKYHFGMCPKYSDQNHYSTSKNNILYLENQGRRFKLRFHCQECIMTVEDA